MLINNYITILVLFSTLPFMVISPCGPGTLRCINPEDATNSRALICDPSQNYVLFESSCVQQIIPNCLLTIEQNRCKVCEFGYYLTNDRKCAAVPRKTPSDIRSCNFYGSIDECVGCNIKSYNRNGLCRPATRTIDNCTLMEGKETCGICDLKLPSYNQTFCNTPNINEFDKCLLIRHPIGCKTCQPGYKKENNYFLTYLSETAIHKSFFEKIGFWRQNFFDIMYDLPTCKYEYQIQDCLELDYNNKCKVCSHGFTLSPDGTRCFIKPTPPRNPKNRIPNCFKFKTENYEECDLCFEGFYLQDNNTKCVNHTEDIPGCNVYSQTDANRCIFCANVNYRTTSISTNNQCGTRANYFENCERYSRTGDKCLECAADHIFHFNNERCSIKIDNCNQYNTSFRILQCQDCIDTHYLNSEETLCSDANNAINGCQKYDKGPSCSKCQSGFYLDSESKTCFFHDTFINCKTLSITVKNICEECQQQGIRTTKTHECTAVSNSVLAFDTNCVNWDESQTCIECITDYVLKDYKYTPDGSSTEITALKCDLEKGCLVWDRTASNNIGGCTKCATGYYLYEYSCNKPNTEFCMYSFEKSVLRYNLQYGNNLESGFPCEVCDEFRLYTVEQSPPEFRCIQSTFFSSVELVPNCLSFNKKTLGGYECRECRRNHILAGNTCTLRTYDANNCYYYDQKDRIVKNTNSTISVTIQGENSDPDVIQTWPLNRDKVAIDDCAVYGPGLRYCMKHRNRWGNVNSGSGNVMTEKFNYPYYDFTVFANYTTDYVIGDKTRYTNALAMDKSDLVFNFTTYKHYISLEDTGGTRKDQEPYIWYDSVPITEVFSAFVGYDPSDNTYSLNQNHADFKRVIALEIDSVKIEHTVCNKSPYMHDTLTTKDYATLKITVINSIVSDNNEPFKHLKKMKTDGVAPKLYPCDSTTSITNCTNTFELIYSAERFIPLLSCFECATDYGVRLTKWRYKNYFAPNNTYDQIVAETDCVKLQNSIDPNDIRMPVVANCYYFERVLHHINNDIIHYCRACAPGSYPTMTEEAPRCVPECAAQNVDGGLQYQCDDWYQCSVKCPADPCDFETSFCDTAAESIGCEPKSKECCADFISGSVDANGDPVSPNTSDFDCDDSTRFKCRRKACLNNCLDQLNANVGLQCDTNTNRCIPSPCADPNCACLKGVCAAELCRQCTSETSASTQYCANDGGTPSCKDYNLCNVAPTTTTRMLGYDYVVNGLKETSGRILNTITTCPPPCEADGSCNKGVFDNYVSDNSYSGNSAYVFCNHYTGECTKLKSILEFVCKCSKFNKIKYHVIATNTTEDYYTKECTEADLSAASLNCICLGNNNYTNLDQCPANGMPTWDPVENVNKPCQSEDQATFLANTTAHNSCSWDTYTVEETNKTTAVNNAAAAASAAANTQAAADAATAAGTAATECGTHKTAAETALTNCETAKTAGNTTNSLAELTAAEAALTSITASTTTATTEKGKAQVAYNTALAEYNADNTNADLTTAKDATLASLTTATGHETTCTTNKTSVESTVLDVKACHYTNVATVQDTEASTQATTAESQKALTVAQEAIALTAKTNNVLQDAENAETAATTSNTASGAAHTAAVAAQVLVEDAKTQVTTLLTANPGHVALTTASSTIGGKSTSTATSVSNAETSKNASALSLLRITSYKYVIGAKAQETTAANNETATLGHKNDAETAQAAAETAKSNGDQSAADAAVVAANTSFTSATSTALDAGSAASTARALANAVNTYKTNNSDSILDSLYTEIDGIATNAETSATNANTYKDAAEAAKIAAETAAAGASVVDYSVEVETHKTTVTTQKGLAETAESNAASAGDAATALTEAGNARTAVGAANTAVTSANGNVTSAEGVKNTKKTAYDADTANATLQTEYNDALEDYEATLVSAKQAEVLAVEAMAAAITTQVSSCTQAANQATETWDVYSGEAVTYATAAQTAAQNVLNAIEYFRVQTENHLIAQDTSKAASSNTRAATLLTSAASALTAVTKINTAMTNLRTLYDTEKANNDATVVAMESTIAANENHIFSAVANVNLYSDDSTRSKNNTQAAVDGNAGTDYSATANTAKTSATTNAGTANSKLGETTGHIAAPDHGLAVTSAGEAKIAANAAEVAYMTARSAMRIAQALDTNGQTALAGGTITQSAYDALLEDFELASIAATEAEAEYVRAACDASHALAQADSINAAPLTVYFKNMAKYGEVAGVAGSTQSTTAKNLTDAFMTKLTTVHGNNDQAGVTKYKGYIDSIATATTPILTSIDVCVTAITLEKTTLDAANTAATDTRYTDQQTIVNTSKTNAENAKSTAVSDEAHITSQQSTATAVLGTYRRLLEEFRKAPMSDLHDAKELLPERILSTCPNNKVCINNFNEIDLTTHVHKDDYDAQYTNKGGCKFVCESTVNPKPTPVNDQATEANGVNNCYNSCSTGDSLERCVSGSCVKNCQVADPGLTINCNANEECVLGTGGAANTCIAKPCEPVCDSNYESCDINTNRCSLLPRKPKIQALTICTAVENCDTKYHLNKCYQCSNYYSFKITATGNTAANPNAVVPALVDGVVPSCIHTNIPNALMASEYMDGDVTRYTVEKCAPGYDLDFNNNECVSQIKNCKLNSIDGDCLGCDTPYETASVQLVFGVFEKGYCKTWNEFDTTEQGNLTPPYQEFCKYYQYKYTSQDPAQVNSLKDGQSVCYECDPDYYFANDGTTPADVCINRRTVNCEIYDSASITGTCTQCNLGFELLFAGAPNQECREIVNSTKKIPGCSIYDKDLNCLACEAGYLWRKSGEGSDQTGYCFIEFVDSACSQQDTTVFKDTGAIQCFKCEKVKGIFYYPRKYNTPINSCMYIGQRKLCLNHDFDKADSLNLNNTFQCTLCEADYYLANGVCIRRLNTEIRNCIEYDPNDDKCKTFESTAPVTTSSDEFSTEIESVQNLLLNPPDYLATAQTIDFEGWILSCEIYQSETACSRCFAPKYINEFGFEYNTKCITANTIIENCVYYSDADTCQECFKGYELISNACKLVTVENCATYKSESECGTCPANYPYLNGDGNCTVDPRNMFCLTYIISNDAINLQSSKVFECDTCLENYYPDDSSICTMVETEIHNCKYYAGDGLCKECKDGFYLNFNGKNCFINPPFDPFCKTFSYLTECAVCEKGYYLDDNLLCVQCNPETFPAGCLYCDPKDNATCLICDFGYQMKAEGCVKYITTDPEEPFMRPFNYFIGQTKTVNESKAGLIK